MRKVLLSLVCLLTLGSSAQRPEIFQPVHVNNLRLPAVPLITADPYFCLWSKYDQLFDGSVTHWSGVKKPLNGSLWVDGIAYRFMGESMEAIAPVASDAAWQGRYVTKTPTGTWTAVNYDDSSWDTGAAPWAGGDDGYKKQAGTPWSGDNTDVYIRREFNLDEVDPKTTFYVMYKHDDVFELYVNGTKVVGTKEVWDTSGTALRIDGSLLHAGKNVLACHCHNTYGGAFADMGIYQSPMAEPVQKSCSVTATSSYYTFQCGGVDLDVVFTSPHVMEDLVLFSTPIAYISYQVKANDGKEHDVRLYLQTSAEMAVRNVTQKTVHRKLTRNGFQYRYAGNATQSVCAQTSDLIDWGYVYAFCDGLKGHSINQGPKEEMLKSFSTTGMVTDKFTSTSIAGGTYHSIVYLDSIGQVGSTALRDFTMLGYDDTYSIQYFSSNRKGYWANNGKTSITARFEDMYANYDNIMERCRQTDRQVYDDAYAVGGVKYAEALVSVYRQTNAAHKLFTDAKGNLMFMSRENNSGGFINTLDVTYPSQPLYWVYSPALAKAMITPVFEYNVDRWTYDFPNHDLGHYPQANGNHYGNPTDGSGTTMPVEQSGNMLTLAAIIAQLDGDYAYLRKYFKLMTKWANYLVENGKDPANQLCTDDFMGHSARNTNLAMKAIMGVMSYAEICHMLGDDAQADEYRAKAKDMADFWKKTARTTTNGTHYVLNFGANGSTWSTKYNMVWDKIWNWNLFKTERSQEMQFYINRCQTYGLPLDSRGELCKTDWQMWVTGFAETKSYRDKMIGLLWKYINETPSRVPVSDIHYVKDAKHSGFQARSVVGGYWMPVFVNMFHAGTLNGIGNMPPAIAPETEPYNSEWYDLYGRKVANPTGHGIYIKNGKKVLRR